MGSCVSVHKDPGSAMKLRFSIGSKNEKLLIPSPVKEKPATVNVGDGTVAVRSQFSPARFPNGGSKDESFFDSQPWLESDCEDDFVSVNGDFTPSRGSTPVHHNFSLGVLQINKAPIVERTTDSVQDETSSPPDKKKRLSELFKESLRGDEQVVDVETAKLVGGEMSLVQNPKSKSGTPYLSGDSSERTPYGDMKTEDKSLKSGQCCLPRLISSRSFSERRKRTSPLRSFG